MSEKERIDKAVDDFAEAMKARLNSKHKQGWHGWRGLSRETIGPRLLFNAAKGIVKLDSNSIIDTANFAMFLWRIK